MVVINWMSKQLQFTFFQEIFLKIKYFMDVQTVKYNTYASRKCLNKVNTYYNNRNSLIANIDFSGSHSSRVRFICNSRRQYNKMKKLAA